MVLSSSEKLRATVEATREKKRTKGDEKERERKDTRRGREKKDGPVKKLIGARPGNE